MGHYLQTMSDRNKTMELVGKHGAQVIDQVTPETWDQLPAGKSLVCVVENGPFDAAGWAYSKSEVKAFLAPDFGAQRKRTWLVMDRPVVQKLIGKPSLMCDPDWK